MNKVTTNQRPSEKEKAATVVKTKKEEAKTCDGCGENIFCELATFNDRRCQSAVSEKYLNTMEKREQQCFFFPFWE